MLNVLDKETTKSCITPVLLKIFIDHAHECNFVVTCEGAAWCETNILRNLEKNVGGHSILYPHCLKKWGDASPTKLCP